MSKQTSPYGTWPSPISPEEVAATSGGPSWVVGVGRETWWCASDPATATVQLLRCAEPGLPATRVLPAGWSVRNRSLGYGGRPYLVIPGGDRHLLIFTDHRDQRLYRADIAPLADAWEPEPTALTPIDPLDVETCYADPVLAPNGTEILCVRETTRAGDTDPAERTTRAIVAIPLDGVGAGAGAGVGTGAGAGSGDIRVVADSHHFLASARISPDGSKLAWIGWNHPDMPWDVSELMIADLEDGRAVNPVRILGGDGVAVSQAEWDPDGRLYAMADPDGWWNLHRIDIDQQNPEKSRVENVVPLESECAGAIWKVGASWFAVTPAGIALRHGVGDQRLAVWNPDTGELKDLAEEWTVFSGDLTADSAYVYVVAGSTTAASKVLRIALSGSVELCETQADDGRTAWRAIPQRRTAYDANGRDVNYIYYPPTNPDHEGPSGEAPPLLVYVHGGPTSNALATPDSTFSMFCSRGFAVASVDYGGSTGYGREYRDRLLGTWGVVDVEDSVTAARDLASSGLADPRRTAIRGGSAGGWTTLAALTSTDYFCCGAVYYPISDPYSWSGAETHDFESRYIESLIGVLPQDEERYRRVSPIDHVSRITAPLVMLQGADDFICRPDQAQRVVDTVAGRGLWHKYLVFEGEGHGFRRESSVADSLRAEMELYEHVMGIAIHADAAD